MHLRFPVHAPGLVLFLALTLSQSLQASPPGPGGQAPNFKLPELIRNTASVDSRDLRGKVVLVDFWASWCPPCRKTLPHLGRMRLLNPSLVVLAISLDEDRAKAMDFLSPKRDTSLVFLHDVDKSAAADFDLGGMPSLYLIDKHGKLRFRHDGYTERDLKLIQPEIEKLMGEP